jgi:DNA polymerase-1
MDIIAFDIETSGTEPEYALQPCRALTGDGWLTSVAWHANENVIRKLDCDHCFDYMSPPDIEQVREVLRRAAEMRVRVVAWNTAFDAAWLIALGLREEVFATQWLDGMLMRRHLHNFPTYDPVSVPLGLKAAVAEFYPNRANYADDVDFHATSPEEIAKLRKYNKDDTAFTFEIVCRYWALMTPGQRRVHKLEAACIPLVADSIVRGLDIDQGALAELDQLLRDTAVKAQVEMKVVHNMEDVNQEVLASPKKIAELLYDNLKLPIPSWTPKGAPSTDRKALMQLATVDDRAALINTYREATNNRRKFVKSTQESVKYNPDGRTRPAMRVFGTYSGRATYSSKQGRGKATVQTGVALHQWKRAPEFRRLIKPPEGHQLLEFDFAGQEYRWMAELSKDSAMLAMCEPGEDAHGFMGAQISGRDYRELVTAVHAGEPDAKRARQVGKVANLSLAYRTSALRLREAATYQYGLPMTQEEAQAVHATYRATYPGVMHYWKSQERKLRDGAHITNLLGRTVYFSDHEPYQNASWSVVSTAINFPIQSMGAEQKYLALLVLKNQLPLYDGVFMYELHDGLFIAVPDDKAEKAAHELKHILSNLPYKKAWDLKLSVQFPVDAKVGPSWGDLVEV